MPRPLLDGFDFAALAEALAALGADAWLLYDFRHVNPVAERILGPTGMSTRRLFVLLPRSGKPVAVAHRIELQPLAEFPGRCALTARGASCTASCRHWRAVV